MAADRPPLTVVVTNYNRREMLAASIASVLTSSFQDFTLLVVDDASTDGSVEWVRSVSRQDSRVRLSVNSQNLGQFANRNRALELVDSPFIKYHDSDDLMYPHCLEVLMNLIRSEPRAGFAMTSGNHWTGGPCPMLLTPRLSYIREFLGQGLFHCSPSGALFRTDVLRSLGGFPEEGVGSDFIFWHDACARFPVLLAPADLFWYRVHPGQQMTSEVAADDYARAEAHAWTALNDASCPLVDDELRQAKRRYLRRLLRMTIRDLRRGNLRQARLRLSHARVRIADWARHSPFGIPLTPHVGTPLDESGNFVVPQWPQTDR